jgi:putative aldouronate transport system permease protein
MRSAWNFRRTWPLHVLLMPALILVIIFSLAPLPGLVMAFQDYKPWLGITKSQWVGFQHFVTIFTFDEPQQVIVNTFAIAFMKMVTGLVVPIIFALLLNEVRNMALKRSIQTLVYLPHFISWVILGGILVDMLSVDGGLVNQLLGFFHIGPIFFLGDGNWFRVTVIVSDVWKEFGFAAIIFLAAIAGVNTELYEAAVMDGANRWRQTLNVTLPAIIPIIIVVGTLSLGNILQAGFDQIFNLYNPLVYSKGDVIDTYVYREGFTGAKFSFGAAVGLFKSFVGMVFIIVGYRLAYRFGNYRIF